MAYDERRGLVMMYGDRGPEAAVLWAWDGSRWRSFTGPGPGLRRHIKLAYDAARDRLVLYGGYDDAGLDIRSDTWEWDGARWHLAASSGPGPRSGYSLVYDPERRRVVLFGGLALDGVKNDTWAWDGAAWTKLADGGPSPRGEAGAAWDPSTRRIVISGGMAYDHRTLANGRSTFSLRRDLMPRDTWAWDGGAWSVLSDDGFARMAPLGIDPASGSLLRIAGESADGFHGDVLRWSGSAWSPVAGADLPARHGPAAALDSRRGRLVVFGGWSQATGALADLWEWDGSRWTRVSPAAR